MRIHDKIFDFKNQIHSQIVKPYLFNIFFFLFKQQLVSGIKTERLDFRCTFPICRSRCRNSKTIYFFLRKALLTIFHLQYSKFSSKIRLLTQDYTAQHPLPQQCIRSSYNTSPVLRYSRDNWHTSTRLYGRTLQMTAVTIHSR